MKKNSLDNKSLLKKSLAIAGIALFSTSAFALSLPVPSAWKVQDGKLLDPNGNPFIFRGVTVEHNLAPERALQAIRDAAALGANAIQVEINGNIYRQENMITGAQLSAIINTCKESKVVCVLEPNDVAGYPDATGAGIPATAATFWTWPGIREAILGQHGYIILGFGNQYLGAMHPQEYVNRMYTYLADFSSAPLNNFVIMVDGSNWGQDADKAMYELAKQYSSSTAKPQVIYSVDMFDAYVNPETVREYIASYAAIKAPLVVGGFAPVPYYHPHFAGPLPLNAPRLPAESVMQYAEQYGAGYFGWSWSGNKNPALDVVSDWNSATLTSWGNLLFNDVNGIKATAKGASIYQSSSSSYSSSSAPVNQAPVADFFASNYPSAFCDSPNVGAGRITAMASGSSDPDGDPLTFLWSLNGGSSSSASGYEVTFPSQTGRSYQLSLTVTDSKGASANVVKTVGAFYIDCFNSSSRSSSSSSLVDRSSSSNSTYTSASSSSAKSSSSSSITPTKAQCSYQLNSQWSNGFTAAIRIKNTTTTAINGWNVNWQYTDGSKITGSWNATLSGSNPYSAKNVNWNANIQPGQTVEFGFQGSKPAGSAEVPVVSGNICQ
jgi:mannan endo-1,4-beta-mannosidase